MKIENVLWRGGTAYFRRRIPQDLRKHYTGKDYLTFTLKTKDPKEAVLKAQAETTRLEREWALLRSSEGTDLETRQKALAILDRYGLKPGQAAEYRKHDLEPDEFVGELLTFSQDSEGFSTGIVKERLPDDLRMAAELFNAEGGEVRELLVPSFSEVKEKHLYFYPDRQNDSQFDRSVTLFLELNGDLPINQYRREHGNAFVKHLLDKGRKAATVKRYLNQLRPIFNTAIEELEVSMTNPLSKLKVPKSQADDEEGREPFSLQQIWAVQRRCREVDDQRRWLLAVVTDTGARLSEVAGLLTEEVILDAPVPHILIRKNPLRGLKTPDSKRIVPLVGEALWGAERALHGNEGPYLFPDLIKDGALNGGSISAALNGWLTTQRLRGESQPVHSFRHSMRDRLRNAGYAPDVGDRIGGWKSQGIGEGYGAGHDLEVLHRYMVEMIQGEAEKRLQR